MMTEMVERLLEDAWAVIANAGGGNWTRESKKWQGAAAAWRESYFKAIHVPGPLLPMDSPKPAPPALDHDPRCRPFLKPPLHTPECRGEAPAAAPTPEMSHTARAIEAIRQDERESIARWHEQQAEKLREDVRLPWNSRVQALFEAHSESARAIRAGEARLTLQGETK